MSIQPNTYAHTSWVGNMTAAHADAIFTEFMPRGWVSNAAQESLPHSQQHHYILRKGTFVWWSGKLIINGKYCVASYEKDTPGILEGYD